MSEEAIRNVVQELLEGGDLSEDGSELLHFLIQGLRSSKVAVAEAAAQGLLALMRSEGNRNVIKASSAPSALKALHFFERTELSALAEELSKELGDCTREQNHWVNFAYGERGTLSLKVKLSEAREAEILSSHGWRVWPGAQLLTSWMVSEPSFLVGRRVLEATKRGEEGTGRLLSDSSALRMFRMRWVPGQGCAAWQQLLLGPKRRPALPLAPPGFGALESRDITF